MEDCSDDERRENGDFEESGWTMYLEDFYSNTNHNNNEYISCENCSSDFSSLVSDAASLVMNKSNINYDTYNHNNSLRLSLMKKRKTRGADEDDDAALEDTATSPVSSPKITKQKDDSFNINSEVEKGKKNKGSSRNREEDNVSLMIGRESGSSELKKNGLCLVPLSMIVNYFG